MSLSETRIYDSALHYLQRYASTAEQLKRVLQRKLIRAGMRGEEVPPEAPLWIGKAVEKCVRLGYVDDALYAEQKIQALRRQGRSQMFIRKTLQQKGVGPDIMARLLGSDENAEENAAKRYVQRRRLGRDTSPEGKQKDLAKLLRAGFSLNLAKRALQAGEIETFDIEEI